MAASSAAACSTRGAAELCGGPYRFGSGPAVQPDLQGTRPVERVLDPEPNPEGLHRFEAIEFAVPYGGALGERLPCTAVRAFQPILRNQLALPDVFAEIRNGHRHQATQLHQRLGRAGTSRSPAHFSALGEIVTKEEVALDTKLAQPSGVRFVEHARAGRRDVKQQLRVPADRGEIDLDQLVDALDPGILRGVVEPARSN